MFKNRENVPKFHRITEKFSINARLDIVLRRSDTQRIDLSAKAHHDWKVGFVSIQGMHYPKKLR